MSTRMTPEELVKLLGPIEEHDDNLTGDPFEMQYCYFSKLFVWQPGKRVHGWAPGVYPSPYPGDDGFVIVVFNNRSIIRMSELTPGIGFDVLGKFVSALTGLDYENNDFMELDDGIVPVIKDFAELWSKFRSDSRTRREVRGLSEAGAEFIGLLLLSFSHEHYPTLGKKMVDGAVAHVIGEHDHGDGPLEDQRPNWAAAVEASVTTVATSYANFRGRVGLRARPFKKACSMFVAGLIEKLDDGFSIHYTMDEDLAIENSRPFWIGEATKWSRGCKVPILDQRGAELKIERFMRRVEATHPITNEVVMLPSGVNDLINAFAFGSHKLIMEEQEEAKKQEALEDAAQGRPAKIRRLEMPDLE